eukprot:CAMPEP_0181206272 /NCGR_PEP_ID=MMETSP1096-20121128/20942_1 /TAXON_ID=156174 ORGANISM="Chrysochromulina ericina, Strain CCMP281" /NCGR_SAMPLE_ID=MMETSP1096 /ASSEMBLY_ACC=CAM_ASM_000453 /LENGTH=193 /DNA_ID=CAMNT_0023297151 /DNA_START=231 /DNA_END=813 /DNA_ORIENTATION=+
MGRPDVSTQNDFNTWMETAVDMAGNTTDVNDYSTKITSLLTTYLRSDEFSLWIDEDPAVVATVNKAGAGCLFWQGKSQGGLSVVAFATLPSNTTVAKDECARASASCIHEVVLSWCSKQGFLRTAQCRICLKWGARSSLHVHRPPQDPAGPPAPRPPYHLQPVALSAITRARTLGHGGCAAASRAVLRELVVT